MGDVENENPSGGTVKDTAETNTATVAAEAMNAVKDEFRTPIIPASAKDTGLNPDISSDSVDKNTAPCDNVNEFRSPASPASISKKQAGKPVTMTIKSRYAIPADIYKAPKVAVFIADFPSKRTNETAKAKSVEEESEPSKTAKPKAPPAKLSYETPDWCRTPDDGKYSLEVLKNGSIVDNVKLSGKDHFLVGRLPECDIKMDHPSISRYHAVLQYGSPDAQAHDVELQKDGSPGFYVRDLGSTHGTIINKQSVRSKLFYRIKVGHVVKFGGSTRMFILQGPEDDQEQESKESATQLREFNKQKIKKKKDLEKMMMGDDSSSDEDDAEAKNRTRGAETSSVTWGMLEDAVEYSSDEGEETEEGGDTRADHPDAILVQTKKEPFYMKDPMKALKNLYEREKLELDFECSERRSGHWHVKLCLPVDSPGGKPVYAEVNATGKKKDTIRQCAMEACRILDRHGLFHHKGHHKQKAKQWEDDDYYDSDEDEFNDRTGELEAKRKMRMQRIGKRLKGGKTVETYDSLLKKVEALDDEIKEIETKLEKDKAVTTVSADAADPLDAFMQQVKSGKALDTTTRSKLKRRLLEARKERVRVAKLADLARPSSLPPLQSTLSKNYAFVGKMKGRKKTTPVVSKLPSNEELASSKQDVSNETEEFEEDESRDRETNLTKTVKLMDKTENTQPDKIPEAVSAMPVVPRTDSPRAETALISKSLAAPPGGADVDGGRDETRVKCDTAPTKDQAEKRMLGPTVPDELRRRLSSGSEAVDRTPVDEDAPAPKRKRTRQRRRPVKLDKKEEQYSDDPKYSGWIPPEDQSGDGKISLNEKLGY